MPHRKKILLSDSNEAFSMLLTDSLRERGNFHVFHAKDEDETTKALHRHRPHVLLLDFLLPHKGGFHVMQLWGDRIFEKCGIRRDEEGDGGKTLEIRGKRRLSARDGGANYQQS